jgi:hypothetical protein
MVTKLNLLATLGALILFFLPWIDIQCSQRTMITQSGVQSIYGGGTLADEFNTGKENDDKFNSDKDRPAPAILIGLALLLTIVAFGLALSSAFGRKNRDRSVGLVCAAALILIVLQIILKFPGERDIAQSMNKGKVDSGDLSASLGSALIDIRVEYRTPLNLELAALGLPVILLLNSLIDKRRSEQVS